MTTIDPQRVQALFLAALESSDSAARRAFLDRECKGDDALRQRVEALLGAHDATAGFGDAPSDSAFSATIDSPMTIHPGAIVSGRYKLIEAIGEGGMGSVWLAEQKEPVKRKVAIKLIKPGMDSRQVLARFDAERQALALMDHPNIARVFDGGMTDQGRPFFVMEYVKGVPLTEYCDQERLSLDDRLQLFIHVCHAVQHAHQKGVIHRDLKPSNILICLYDGKPVPKVIDFGLAKAMHQPLTDQSLYTAHGMMVGTPLYMSPEQAEHNNLDVDSRTDVYSLGVILYELLTGSTPLERRQMKDAAYNEILQLIKEVEPPKPSTRISGSANLPSIAAQRSIEPNHLKKHLTGDLDWIVMTALAKERGRRYETANGLSRDVERFLNDEPVEACPPSAPYRLRKLLRRNKRQVIAASLLLLTLIAGIAAVLAVQARANANLRFLNRQLDTANTELKSTNALLEQTRIRAEEQEKQAIAAVKRFGDVVANDPELKNNAALTSLRKSLLQEPLAFFQALHERLRADSLTQPQSLARLASASFDLGTLSNEIGDIQDSLRVFQEAVAIQERLVRENPTVSEFQYALAASHNRIGRLQRELRKTSEARASHARAQAIFERLVEDNPANVQFRRHMAINLSNIGTLYSQTGQVAEALFMFRRTREIQERLALENPTMMDLQKELANTHNAVSDRQSEIGQTAEALASVTRAREILERLARENPTVSEFQRLLANSYEIIGRLHRQTGHLAEELASYKQVHDIRERLVRENPTVTRFQEDLARSHSMLGLRMKGSGRTAEALVSYSQQREICERLARENPGVTRFQDNLANCLNNLGRLQHELGRRPEAVEAYTQAKEILEELSKGTPINYYHSQEILASIYNNIGLVEIESGKLAEAIESHTRAMEIQRKTVLERPTDYLLQSGLATYYLNIGVAQSKIGQLTEAMASFNQAREIEERLVEKHSQSPDHASDLGLTLNNMACLDLGAKRFTAARDTFLQAVEWQRKALAASERSPKYRQLLTEHLAGLLRAYQGLDDADGAADAQRQLAELQASDRRAGELVLLDYRPAQIFEQATAIMKSGDTAKSESKLDECMKLAELLHQERSSDTAIFWAWVELTARRGSLYYEVGRHELAVEWLNRAFVLMSQFQKSWPAHNVRERLVHMHRDRALALRMLKRDAEAIGNWNELFDLVVPTELAWVHFNLGVALCNSGDIVKGDQSLHRAMELREQAVQFAAADDRDSGWYAALCYLDVGRFVMHRADKEPAVALLEKAVASFRSYDERWPSEKGKRQLEVALSTHAHVLESLKRYAEAAKSWEQIVETSPVSSRYSPLFRQFRALELAGKSEDANLFFDKSLAEIERLVNEEAPDGKEPLHSLVLLCFSRAKFEIESNRPEPSLIWLDRAEKEIQPIRERWPDMQVNTYFKNILISRIQALTMLRRFEETLPLFDRVIELAIPQELPFHRSMKICATIRAGQLDGQLEAMETLLTDHPAAFALRIAAARAYAIASEHDSLRKEQLSGRAMELLTDLASDGLVIHTLLAQERDLDSLRGRSDFQKLLSKPDPKSPSQGP